MDHVEGNLSPIHVFYDILVSDKLNKALKKFVIYKILPL